jgi:hypothetical protein
MTMDIYKTALAPTVVPPLPRMDSQPHIVMKLHAAEETRPLTLPLPSFRWLGSVIFGSFSHT